MYYEICSVMDLHSKVIIVNEILQVQCFYFHLLEIQIKYLIILRNASLYASKSLIGHVLLLIHFYALFLLLIDVLF